MSTPLRLVTYMVPSMPRSLYEAVAERLEAELGPTELAVDSSRSGPADGGPLVTGAADVAFLCAVSVLELEPPGGPGVHVLAAPVPLGERAGGQPRYWSDLIVRADLEVDEFHGLQGCSFAFNDTGSLSGLWSVAARLVEEQLDWGFFSRTERSGAHVASVARVAAGKVDAAAIDSIVLARLLEEDPSLAQRVRRVGSLGPFPSPPVVSRLGVPSSLREVIARVLCDAELGKTLHSHGCAGFARIDVSAYERCRAALSAGVALGPPPN